MWHQPCTIKCHGLDGVYYDKWRNPCLDNPAKRVCAARRDIVESLPDRVVFRYQGDAS